MDQKLDQSIEECTNVFSERSLEVDRNNSFPINNFKLLNEKGLLELPVSEKYGGHELALGGDHELYVNVLSEISAACPNTGHCFGTHCWALSSIRLLGTEEQHEYFANQAKDGAIFANFGSEPDQDFTSDGERVEYNTTASEEGDGWIINGKKFFATNSTHADYQAVYALPEGGELKDLIVPIVSSEWDGITVHDTWDGMGQRSTASGMVEFNDVFVPKDHVVGEPGSIVEYGHVGTSAAITIGSILLGIGKGALEFSKWWLDNESKPPTDRDNLSEDPHVQLRIGDMDIHMNAAEELLHRSARTLEKAESAEDPDLDAKAKADAFRARVMATRASVETSSQLFNVTGARSTSRQFGSDLYWRCARTLSLHDVVDKQITDIARYILGLDERGGFAR
ncbi:acyl-CoA dehydrogenase family protein [Natrinema halophilum]|uniref:acyl-CoA dehydrogenase family protein n=1 Tax=Natrinema halophilum TaxID=1699371 RepID=UPI001F19BE7E|nr:acyl-CoA dehydrogenase family protein [Natrinema halophilum]UHQ96218.1 acyl-CoA dehydrogenase family protein [Natrinema halophilum]